jgi:hypothetical protein
MPKPKKMQIRETFQIRKRITPGGISEDLWSKISSGCGSKCHFEKDNVTLRQKIAY